MADEIIYGRLNLDESVTAVLNGETLRQREIPDLRALIEEVQRVAEERNIDITALAIRCENCSIINAECGGVRIDLELDILASPPSTIFAGCADFSRTTFTGKAVFDCAKFTKYADFSGATFTEDASFFGATFKEHASFSNATFTKDAHFLSATFTNDAHFASARFTKGAHFDGATFMKDAKFSGATFTEDAGFESATFTKNAHFGATFTKGANFYVATFTEDTYFYKAKIRKWVYFGRARVNGAIGFTEAELSADAQLGFEEIDLRPGGRIILTAEQIRRRRPCLIQGEDSDDRDELRSAAAQYNVLRDNFRALPSTDDEEDLCHYKYMDLRRRSSEWSWPQRLWDRFVLKLCWGYGVYPARILLTIVAVVALFALAYWFWGDEHTIANYYAAGDLAGQASVSSVKDSSFNAIYFSVVTFTTIGYGDYAPLGPLRWVACLEGFLGLFLMAVFTVSMARKFIR